MCAKVGGFSGAGAGAAASVPLADRVDEIRLDLHFPIKNAARSVGARLSGEIARRMSTAGFPADSITLNFHGIAGQSFGAFCNKGMKLVLRGEAHDYVGKSMHGGSIVLSPQAVPVVSGVAGSGEGSTAATKPVHAYPADAPPESPFLSFPIPGHRENVICGNTVMYGATGGSLFAAGRAGERFAVRNSGGTAVVEGCGNHGCEYMTNGVVVVLGTVGRNFGAGMSGGEAFVLDLQDAFLDAYNPGMIEPERVVAGSPEDARLRSLVEAHVAETGSAYGAHVLAHWDDALDFFWRCQPNTTPVSRNSQAVRGGRGGDRVVTGGCPPSCPISPTTPPPPCSLSTFPTGPSAARNRATCTTRTNTPSCPCCPRWSAWGTWRSRPRFPLAARSRFIS